MTGSRAAIFTTIGTRPGPKATNKGTHCGVLDFLVETLTVPIRHHGLKGRRDRGHPTNEDVMTYSAWAPLAGYTDLVLLVARIITGGTMIYYGWPKVKDPRKNREDIANAGFRPAWLWGTIVMLVEFAGGIAIVLGVYTWVAAALIGFEMFTGTLWKITRAHKPFPEYSYDLLLLALALVLLAVGPGAYAVT
jgi:putative oxidoreductase